MRPVVAIAAGVFALVAVVHLLRLVLGWEVTLNGMIIPMWVSILGLVIAGGLALALWREARRS